MKKLFVCLFLSFFCFASMSEAATKMWGRDTQLGGTKSVDNIEYADLVDGYLCFVVTSAKTLYIYRWEDSILNATAEDSPWLIKPDDVGANNGGWELITTFYMDRTATPANIFRDSDCTDDDDNVKVYVECSTTVTNTEDCDYFIQVQINGTLTTVLTIDADGSITFALPLDGGDLDIANVGDINVDTVTADGASVGIGSGTDDVILNFDGVPDSTQTYSGTVIRGKNCGENLAIGDVVFYDSADADPWHEADATVGSGEYPARGIAVAACTDGNEALIMTQGILRDDTLYNWGTVGGSIWLGETDGLATQTVPTTSNDCVQTIGWAISADVAYFNFSGHWMLVE